MSGKRIYTCDRCGKPADFRVERLRSMGFFREMQRAHTAGGHENPDLCKNCLLDLLHGAKRPFWTTTPSIDFTFDGIA